ncbi:MAG: hypothetical protein FJZ57_06590 [Chlamydiae bacterium]|nr:hypothetical protein [Chlamydiota bacterium]
MKKTFINLFTDAHGDDSSRKGPILTFSKLKSQSNVIMIPDFEALSGHAEIHKSVQMGKSLFQWYYKIEKGFWRGSRTGSGSFLNLARTKCVELSLKYPDLIDARFSDFHPNEYTCMVYPEYFSNGARIADHLKFKYQINIDGNASTYGRLFWQLFSGCLVFNQESDFTQWYHFKLQPYVHFVPFKNDISDLPEKIIWAKKNDKTARIIARNAEIFANTHLNAKAIYDYLYYVICTCSKLSDNSN